MTGPAVAVDDFATIATEVWNTFITDDAVVIPFASERPGTDSALAASIAVEGDWTAVITLRCDDRAATDLARRMLRLTDNTSPVGDEDVVDVLAELINVVGGNVKSLVEGHTSLTLPEVHADVAGRADHESAVCWLDVVWSGGQASLDIWSTVQTAAHDISTTEGSL